MGPWGHAVISAPLAAGVWAITRDPISAAATFVAGTCIDVDHIVDYVRARGLKVDISAVRTGAYFRETGQALVLLHSYELIVAACLLVWWLWSGSVALGLFCGALGHLLTDLVFYRFRPLCYSLVYRLKTGFALGSFRFPVGVEGGASTR